MATITESNGAPGGQARPASERAADAVTLGQPAEARRADEVSEAARQSITRTHDALIRVPRNGIDVVAARELVHSNLAAMRQIAGTNERLLAATVMGQLGEQYAAYQTELGQQDPAVAIEVAAALAAAQRASVAPAAGKVDDTRYQYVVTNSSTQQRQAFTNAPEAAGDFHKMDANDRPNVVRVWRSGGPESSEKAQVIARTEALEKPGPVVHYRKIAEGIDPQFEAAYGRLTIYPSPDRGDGEQLEEAARSVREGNAVAGRRRAAAGQVMPTEAEREVNEIHREPAVARDRSALSDEKQARELKAAYAQQRDGQRRRGRPTRAERAKLALEARQAQAQAEKDTLTLQRDVARVAGVRARDSAAARAALLNQAFLEPALQANSPSNNLTDRASPILNPALQPALPADLASRYVATQGSGYALRHNPSRVEFRDFGDALRAENNNVDVADTLVRIAQDRRFEAIKVRGTAAFRREIWIEATARDIAVSGYTPEARDQAEMLRRAKAYGKAENIVERAELPVKVVGAEEALRAAMPAYYASKGVAVSDAALEEAIQRTLAKRAEELAQAPPKVTIRPVQGTVIDSGFAPYLHEEGNQQSFYVRLLRDDGQLLEKWGKTLSKAAPEHLRVGTQIEITKSPTNTLVITPRGNELVKNEDFARQARSLNDQREAEITAPHAAARADTPRAGKSIPPPIRTRGRGK